MFETTSSGGTETNRNRKEVFEQLISECNLSKEKEKELKNAYMTWIKSHGSNQRTAIDLHHIDGSGNNNSLDNVIFITKSDHSYYHNKITSAKIIKKDLRNVKNKISNLQNDELDAKLLIDILEDSISTIIKN